MTYNEVLHVGHSQTQHILQCLYNIRNISSYLITTRPLFPNPSMLEYAVLVSSNRVLEARDDDNGVTESMVISVDEVEFVELFNVVEWGFANEHSKL